MNWIFCTKQLGTFEDVPLFFIPNIPLLGLGIIVVPMACLAMLTRIAFLFVHSVPRLYTIPLFLGMAVVPLLIGATGWSKTDYSLRWLVAVVISAFTVFGEILLRRLPKPFFEAAVLSLATSIGIYFFLMCVVISASI